MDATSFETFFKSASAKDSTVGAVFVLGGLFLGLLGASFLRTGLGISAFCVIFWLVVRFKRYFGEHLYYIAPLLGLIGAFLASKLVDLGLYIAAFAAGYLGGSVARDILFDSIAGLPSYYKYLPIATSLLASVVVFFLKRKLLVVITSVIGSILVYHGGLTLAVIVTKRPDLGKDVIAKPICVIIFALLFWLFQERQRRKKKQDEK